MNTCLPRSPRSSNYNSLLICPWGCHTRYITKEQGWEGDETPLPHLYLWFPFFPSSFLHSILSFILSSLSLINMHFCYQDYFIFFFLQDAGPQQGKARLVNRFSSIIKVWTKLHANTEKNVKQTPFQKHRRRCTEEEARGVNLSSAWASLRNRCSPGEDNEGKAS